MVRGQEYAGNASIFELVKYRSDKSDATKQESLIILENLLNLIGYYYNTKNL